MIRVDNIERFAERVRQALEVREVREAYIGFHAFPSGSCMDASILLGILLAKYHFGPYDLVAAHLPKGGSHSWLQNETFIIDLTADQFQKWPPQPRVILKSPLPRHYAAYTIDWTEPVAKHAAIAATGFQHALRIVERQLFPALR